MTQTFTTTDLVLQLAGGQRDGEQISVSTPKCFLESGSVESGESLRCAIFRGPQGAAVRSYSNAILVNGAPESVHWLAEGDRIEFPNSVTIQIKQLGWIADEQAVTELEQTEFLQTTTPALACLENDADLVASGELRFEKLETQIEAIHVQNDETRIRFEQISDRLENLTDQVSQLVQLASQGSFNPTAPTSANLDSEDDLVQTLADSNHAATSIVPTLEAQSLAAEFPTSTEETFVTIASTPQAPEQTMPEVHIDPCVNAWAEPCVSDISEETTASATVVEQTEPAPAMAVTSADEATDNEPESFAAQSDLVAEPATNEEPIAHHDALASDAISTAQELVEPAPAATPAEPAEVAPTVELVAPVETIAESTAEPSEADTANVELEQPVPAPLTDELDDRLSELERVFGRAIAGDQPTESTVTESAASETTTAAKVELATSELAGSELETPANLAPAPAARSLEEPTNDRATSADSATEPASQNISDNDLAFLESLTAQTADDQPVESPESLTHSPSEMTESSADLTTDVPVGSLASQLLDAVAAEEAEIAGAPESAVDHESKANEMIPATAAADKKPVAATESVSDLFARMKSEGQWSGLDDDDDEEPQTDSAINETVTMKATESDDAGDGSSDDVEDYMAQLLSRMRGGEPAPKAKPAEKPAQPTKEQTPGSVNNQKAEPFTPLTPEEFKPKRVATKIESFDKMRELANSSSRSAVMESEENRRKALGYLQMAIAGASFALAVFYFFFYSSKLFDTGCLLGVVMLGLGGYLCFRYYKTQKEVAAAIESA